MLQLNKHLTQHPWVNINVCDLKTISDGRMILLVNVFFFSFGRKRTNRLTVSLISVESCVTVVLEGTLTSTQYLTVVAAWPILDARYNVLHTTYRVNNT